MGQLKYGYNKTEYKKFTAGAWRYLILFSLLYCAHYCTRLNIGNAQVYMTEFSSEDIGILSSVLFWSYGVGHLINGRLGEIFGIRRFIILSVILSTLCNILMGFQTSIIAMATIWGFNGLFQSMAWSPGISSLTAWWPGDKRGFATGFANAFSGFGQVVATLMVALGFVFLPDLGWRSAFFVPAILPVLMLVVYWFFAKASPKDIGLPDYEEEDKDKEFFNWSIYMLSHMHYRNFRNSSEEFESNLYNKYGRSYCEKDIIIFYYTGFVILYFGVWQR